MELIFDPDRYDATIPYEIGDYDGLQRQIAEASAVVCAHAILDLGIGTGATALRVLRYHDASSDSTAAKRCSVVPLSGSLTRNSSAGRLQNALPTGPFDLIISALAVHHLDGPEKRELFRRVARVLAPGGHFVLGGLAVLTATKG